MNLFVTGGTGFIGSHFIRTALDAGHRVVALRRTGSHPRIPLEEQPVWLEKDLGGCEPYDFQDIDTLIHFAAVGVNPNNANWDNCFQTNLTDSLKILRIASTVGVKRFVICGSCFEYGKTGECISQIPTTAQLLPTGPYHASKAAATLAACALAYSNKLECAILRPFHVFGVGEDSTRFWPSLRAACLAGHDYSMTHGEQVRDFIEVEQVAAHFLDVAVNAKLEAGRPEILNVGSGQPQTLREFAEFWWLKWGATGKLKFGQIPYREGEVMRYVPEILK